PRVCLPLLSAAQRNSWMVGPSPTMTKGGGTKESCRTLSQRNVVVLFPGILELLVPEHGERAADALAGRVRQDHVVDEAARARDERVGELLPVLLGAVGDLLLVADIGAENDPDGALRAHHCNLRRGPGEIDVAADVLGAHDVIGPAIGLARDDGDL